MLSFLAGLVVRLLVRFRVYARERVPRTGGCLLVANRVGPLDRLMFRAACPRGVRILPDRGYDVTDVAAALDGGACVLLFPEGGPTGSGHLRTFGPELDAILAATSTAVVVVPACSGGLWGGRWSLSPGQPTDAAGVTFGDPLPKTTPTPEVRLAVEVLRAELAIRLSDYTPLVHQGFVRRAVSFRGLFRPAVIDYAAGEKTLTGGKLFVGAMCVTNYLRGRVGAEKNVGVWLPRRSAGRWRRPRYRLPRPDVGEPELHRRRRRRRVRVQARRVEGRRHVEAVPDALPAGVARRHSTDLPGGRAGRGHEGAADAHLPDGTVPAGVGHRAVRTRPVPTPAGRRAHDRVQQRQHGRAEGRDPDAPQRGVERGRFGPHHPNCADRQADGGAAVLPQFRLRPVPLGAAGGGGDGRPLARPAGGEGGGADHQEERGHDLPEHGDVHALLPAALRAGRLPHHPHPDLRRRKATRKAPGRVPRPPRRPAAGGVRLHRAVAGGVGEPAGGYGGRRDAGVQRARHRGPADRRRRGAGVHAGGARAAADRCGGAVVCEGAERDGRLPAPAGEDEGGRARRLVQHRRRGAGAAGRLHPDHGARESLREDRRRDGTAGAAGGRTSRPVRRRRPGARGGRGAGREARRAASGAGAAGGGGRHRRAAGQAGGPGAAEPVGPGRARLLPGGRAAGARERQTRPEARRRVGAGAGESVVAACGFAAGTSKCPPRSRKRQLRFQQHLRTAPPSARKALPATGSPASARTARGPRRR